jgi:rubrerythrin
MREAIERLDALMRDLIEADQSAAGMEPLKVANELGRIRQLMSESPAVIPAAGGQRHFRCESCGTIVHGAAAPDRCSECGGTTFFAADMEQPNVESGAG